jgi:hypothetical protein
MISGVIAYNLNVVGARSDFHVTDGFRAYNLSMILHIWFSVLLGLGMVIKVCGWRCGRRSGLCLGKDGILKVSGATVQMRCINPVRLKRLCWLLEGGSLRGSESMKNEASKKENRQR